MSLPGQALLNNERKEAPQLLGSRKNLTGEDLLELSANSRLRQVASRGGSCVGFEVHRVHVRLGVYNGAGNTSPARFPGVEHRKDLAPSSHTPQFCHGRRARAVIAVCGTLR